MDEVEAIAAETRALVGLGPNEPVAELARWLELAGVLFVTLPEGIEGHSGMSAWPNADERPVIAYAGNDPGDRQRFTIAHELGHCVMHSRTTVDGKDGENQAHRFAGAFLMPEEAARHEFDESPIVLKSFVKMKARWGISISALVMRAHDLGYIDRTRVTGLFKQISSRGWRVNEPVSVGAEEPTLLRTLATQAAHGQLDYRRLDGLDHLSAFWIRTLVEGTPVTTEDERTADVISIHDGRRLRPVL